MLKTIKVNNLWRAFMDCDDDNDLKRFLWDLQNENFEVEFWWKMFKVKIYQNSFVGDATQFIISSQ